MEVSELKLSNVIDIATGLGQFINYLLAENASIESIIGIDTCENSIAQAVKNFNDPRVSFAVADASKLNFEPNSFSAVTLNNSLHHFEDIKNVLDEARRILSPRGYLIVNEMCSDNNQSPAQLSHIMIHHWFAKLDKYMNRFHDLTFSTHKISKLISDNGFRIIHQKIYDSELVDPKNERLIENYTNTILTTKKRLENNNNIPKSLLDESESIVEHLQLHGFSPARNVLIIAKKN